MAKRKEPKKVKDIKLEHPDRSGPTQQTLLDIAQERGILDAAIKAESRSRRPGANGADEDEDVLSPFAERILETLLWTVTLATLHFTLDVLVHHQYAVTLRWPALVLRSGRAWLLFLLLFWVLHPHERSNPDQILLPGRLVPLRYQASLRQAVFFVMSAVAGCYLIYISNEYGYLSIMKQAPPLGCLWLWAVVEMDLLWAVPSLAIAVAYLWKEGYSVK